MRKIKFFKYIKTHKYNFCKGYHCVVHSPSKHHMRKWPMNIRFDRTALVERICKHGVGHPDPDSIAYLVWSGKDTGIHGCCGKRCCRKINKGLSEIGR